MNTPRRLQLRRGEVSELLTAVFTLCNLDPSLTPEILQLLTENARRKANARVTSLKTSQRSAIDFDVLGHVIYIWQRSPRYLSGDGQPRALHPRGPAPSIEALFKEVRRADYVVQGLKDLVRMKRIRRSSSGLYVPCSEVTIVDELTPEFVRLVSQSMRRLVSTVLHNISHRDPKAIRLVERMTSVPDLPAKQVRAFKIFAREQGGALINTMNDWLESRRGERKPRKSRSSNHVTAGLHVFSFVEKCD
jgi:hypothetical protein